MASGLSEPPSWAASAAGRGLFWRGRCGAGVSRPGIRAAGFKGRAGGAHTQAQHCGRRGQRLGRAAQRPRPPFFALFCGVCPAALCGRDDKHFT